ncbi:inositol polyphosphate kinase-domain-containing protein [Lipomyces japonicus]|uniref:inositol polyphosphate kinase-domain-containing protein n=1 Tax=Lipomyces japonicus TaxID=56871 RepID=UPI0034CEC924
MEPLKLNLADAVALDNKVAGHDGVLQDPTGSVVIKPSVALEIEFYESLSAHVTFRQVVPPFYGVLELAEQQTVVDVQSGDLRTTIGAERAIVLENVTAGFVKPSVIDVKLGRQLWDERASHDKRKRLDDVSNKTTSGSLGLRIAGMKVWHAKDNKYRIFDKSYGRSLNDDTISNGIRDFITIESVERQRVVVDKILKGIQQIQQAVESEESRMYSASILIAYETDPETFDIALHEENEPKDRFEGESEDEELEFTVSETIEINGTLVKQVSISGAGEITVREDADEEEKPTVRVKLIDFAHATWVPGQGNDENALYGIRNLYRIFAEYNF